MELNLDLSLNYVPSTVTDLLKEVSRTKPSSEKLLMLEDYVKRLEDEKRKIDAFRRELPLCMLLLNDAIVRLKEEMIQCSKQENRTSIEEFLPLDQNSDGGAKVGSDYGEKKKWMCSTQLWSPIFNFENQHPDSESPFRSTSGEADRSVPENPILLQNHRNNGGAFSPFKANSSCKEVSTVPSLSLIAPISEFDYTRSVPQASCGRGAGGGRVEQAPQQQPFRKQRRCWSPELHRRFVEALERLGGSQVATPKQIRELMQVDGLTNDEVKSHLQKYRLHIRRLPASSNAMDNGLWIEQGHGRDHLKANIPHSDSPQGPLPTCGSAKDISSTADDSMDAEEDQNSDGHSCKRREFDV